MIKRKPKYFVKREKHVEGMRYWVYVEGYKGILGIKKKPEGWYACSMYHKTLRDAIIYCAYGV